MATTHTTAVLMKEQNLRGGTYEPRIDEYWQGECSCGFLGPRRNFEYQAANDMLRHMAEVRAEQLT